MNELSLAQKAPRNIVWNFIGQGWLIILALVATPFIVHRLDVGLYGIYVLISVVIDYFAFLQFGMGAAAIKYIAQYLARGDHEKVRMTFWTGMVSHFFMGLLGMTLIIICAGFFVNRIFNINPQLKDTALFALRVGSAGFLLSLLTGMTAGVIRALGRFDIMNVMGIVFGTLQVGSTVCVLLAGFSLKEIIIANLAVQLAGLYGYWYYSVKLMPYLKDKAWSREILIRLLKFGGFVTVSGFVGPILTNIEKIYLTALRSVSTLTYYAVPFSLINRLSVIPSSFSSVLFPLFSFYRESSGDEFNKEIHYRSILYLCLLYAVPFLFILFFGRAFLSWWVGHDFAENSTTILMLLGFAGLVNAAAYPSITALQGMGKPQWPAAFHVLETIFYIPAGYFLIKSYGGVGAAIAWLSRVLLDTLLLHGAACRLFGESLIHWYGKLLYRGLPPVLFITVLFWGLQSRNLFLLHPFNILGLSAIVAAYGCVLWKWILDSSTRYRLIQWIKDH
jgi:O-antigen/teichoic acid export membrane protein